MNSRDDNKHFHVAPERENFLLVGRAKNFNSNIFSLILEFLNLEARNCYFDCLMMNFSRVFALSINIRFAYQYGTDK